MIKKIVAVLVYLMVVIGSAFTVFASMSIDKQSLVSQSISTKQGSTTLITLLGLTIINDDRVIEVDSGGMIIWQIAGLNMPCDAERLTNGNTLITEGNDRVIEVDTEGTIVWEYTVGLYHPWDAERLANGNTLITDTNNGRVIEVDTSDMIVWEKTGLNMPVDVERLTNGNTLITEYHDSYRVIEVDSGGTIVWEKAGLNFPIDAERLSNGNTLITEWSGNRVIEVDSSGMIVWEYSSVSGGHTADAERFANGNTLITEYYFGNRVIEVDSSGIIVWQKSVPYPFDAERISNPPSAPAIDGKTSGKAGKDYEYIFNSVDLDGDDLRYFIDWGDDTGECTDFNVSGTDVELKHNWSEKGTYNISAKAQDIYGFEGPEGTLTVTIPRTRTTFIIFLIQLFERFPMLSRLLTLVLL